MGFKVFFSVLSIVIVFIISSISFSNFQWSKTFFDVKNYINTNWVYNINFDENQKYIQNKWFNKDSLLSYERFNNVDKIYFLNENSYQIKSSDLTENIILNKWKFIVSLWLSKKYEISWTWFNIWVVWPAKLYIDTDNNNKITIFSFDNILSLWLFWLDDEKEKTKAYLYPHNIITFKPHLNKILSNADFLRLSQVHNIGYIKDSLYIDEIDFENLGDLNNDFFKNILRYLNYDNKNNHLDKKLFKKDFDLSKYDNLKKYFLIFINNSKKISYYKDLIYINLVKISIEDNLDNYLFIDTVSYFDWLRNLDKDEYENMVEYLIYFKNKSLYDFDINKNNVEKKNKYDEMYSKIMWFQHIESNYILNSIFNSYDLGNKDLFFNWIISFSKNYLSDSWLKIVSDKVNWYIKTKSIEMSYYIIFLENIISSNLLTNVKIEDINYIFDVFRDYSILSTSIISTLEDNKKKTTIVLQLELLKKLDWFIRSVFFENEMKYWNILVKRKWFEIDSSRVEIFERSFNILMKFFVDNKFIFDSSLEKDKLYVEEYDNIINVLGEYISALKDYTKYELKKNELWWLETIWINNWVIEYNLDYINKYISEFNWLNNDSYKITTLDKKVYSVELLIWWKSIKFDLYPYDNFYLRNIYLDWVKRGDLTYNLSDIKLTLDEKYSKSNSTEDRDKYNFKNFFINTFLKVDTSKVIVEDNNKNSDVKEDTYILVFKRDKLLWSKGEFYILKDFTDIKSEDIIITNNSWKYDIRLKDARIFFSYQVNNTNTTNWAYLTSDYIFDETSHYFDNIKLKIYKNIQVRNWEDKNLWLWDNEILVNWKIDIRDLKDYMYEVLKYYDSIVIVNNLLLSKTKKTYISIDQNRKIKYSFTYNSKNFEFYLNKDNIVSIKVDFNEKIKTPFSYTLLQDYIDLLVK